MAEKNNAKCSICGEEYYVCLSCRDSMKVNPWKIHCDTASHYQIYQVIHGYNTKVYTKDEAKIRLKNINLEDMRTFRPHIKKIIEDILTENEYVVKSVEKVEEIIEAEVATEENKVENAVVENVGEIEKSEDIVKTSYSRKRNYRVDAE